ncbi:MAG: divergent polysaccharide deacetylase family protein [Thalassovita sp.]|nr:divergent polysaccharide deacetylase family protein [Thalassovita sp.]
MAKGALGGFLVGVVASVIVAAVASVITMQQMPQPEAGAVEPVPGSGFDGAREDRAADLPGESAPVETTTEAPRAAQPRPEPDAGSAIVDTQPAEQPETVSPEAGLIAPSDNGEAPVVTAAEDSPVMAAPPTEAPVLPAPESDPAAPAAPVTPPQPEEPELATLPQEENAPDLPDAVPTDTLGKGTAVPIVPAPEADAVLPTAPEPAPVPEAIEERIPAEIVALDPGTPVSRPALPSIGKDRPESPAIGTPATRLTDDEPVVAVAEAPVADKQQSPLDAYAVPFDNAEDKPLMAIVLIDRGDSKIGLDALASFPYPITFAVDAASPSAGDRMARYRESGFEVLALADIPLGATAADTETLLLAGLRQVPEAVGVMEGDGTGLQSDRVVSDQAAALLAETGHGLVLFPKGLDTARKLALKQGVPAATVFRDFDGKDQSATVIRRFLDQAAFKARQQEEGVIMVGRLRADTISALLLWGLQDRASRVALAPVSAVLKAARD